MDWNINWAFWRRRDTSGEVRLLNGSANQKSDLPAEPRRLEDWQARLVDEGVSEEWAPRLAKQLEPLYKELGDGSAEALIRATVTSVDVQAEAHALVERNMRDVREVERLLGAFSGELEKLDEVLEVLAAYAQRMRTKPDRRPPHTLH